MTKENGIERSTAEEIQSRERLYGFLSKELRPIAELLDGEGQTELDGKLWVLAGKLCGLSDPRCPLTLLLAD